MSMFPSHPRDHTYWPGAQYLCICSNLATQNCWPQQAADHLLLSQSATIRNTSSPLTLEILLLLSTNYARFVFP